MFEKSSRIIKISYFSINWDLMSCIFFRHMWRWVVAKDLVLLEHFTLFRKFLWWKLSFYLDKYGHSILIFLKILFLTKIINKRKCIILGDVILKNFCGFKFLCFLRVFWKSIFEELKYYTKIIFVFDYYDSKNLPQLTEMYFVNKPWPHYYFHY